MVILDIEYYDKYGYKDREIVSGLTKKLAMNVFYQQTNALEDEIITINGEPCGLQKETSKAWSYSRSNKRSCPR